MIKFNGGNLVLVCDECRTIIGPARFVHGPGPDHCRNCPPSPRNVAQATADEADEAADWLSAHRAELDEITRAVGGPVDEAPADEAGKPHGLAGWIPRRN